MRLLRAHPTVADTAIGMATLALVALEVWFGPVPASARPANPLAAPFFTLSLALRRTHPVTVAMVAVAAVKLEGLAAARPPTRLPRSSRSASPSTALPYTPAGAPSSPARRRRRCSC